MRCLFCLPLLAGLAAGPVLAQDPSPEALREMKSLPMQSVWLEVVVAVRP